MKNFSKLILTTFIILFSASQAFSWGQTGHRVVGQIAENHLSPAARTKLKSIMNSESLARASTWPDEIRSDESRADQNTIMFWHFVTIPDGQTYEASTKNPKGDAVVAIGKMIEVLKSAKTSRDEKRDAIRWLTHLVGDIHQPLHVGNEKDRGGNLCKVRWDDHVTNLHSLADDEVIERVGLSFTEWVGFLDTKDSKKIKEIQKNNLPDWIAESQSLRSEFYRDAQALIIKDPSYCAKQPDATVADEKALDYSSPKSRYRFVFLMRPLIERRLLEGGLRLAKILNQSL